MTENQNIKIELEEILISVAKSEHIKNYEVFFDITRAQGDGFLSEFFTGKVVSKDNGQTIQVAIKKAPAKDYLSNFGSEKVFKNEVYFYSEVYPELNKFQRENNVRDPFDNVPKYFAGSMDSKNLYVAMENLKTAGYELFDKKRYLDKEHIEIIFKAYGKLHALSFAFKKRKLDKFLNFTNNLYNIIEDISSKGNDEVVNAMQQSFKSALDAFDPVTDTNIFSKLKLVDVKNSFKEAEAYKGDFKCLIHGDCWSNNMLFKYRESGEIEDIKLIDFQLTRYSTPIHDLSYFFYSGASKGDMDKLDHYLDLYYKSFSNFAKELGENPEQLFPLDILKKEWKQYGQLGVFLGCQLWVAKLMEKTEIVDMLAKNPGDFGVFEKSMAEIRKSKEFIERAQNICIHAVEYGIL